MQDLKLNYAKVLAKIEKMYYNKCKNAIYQTKNEI
jgi:hypothetical protein